jgi:hypothetical protein
MKGAGDTAETEVAVPPQQVTGATKRNDANTVDVEAKTK